MRGSLRRTSRAFRVLRVVNPGIADVAGKQGARLVRDFLGELYGLAVQSLDLALPVDNLHLVPMGVIGQREHYVGAGAHELAVQFLYRYGKVDDNLRHVRA